MFVDVGVQEGHVHPKWFVGGRFTLVNLFFENMRVHASAAQQASPPALLTALAKRHPLAQIMPA